MKMKVDLDAFEDLYEAINEGNLEYAAKFFTDPDIESLVFETLMTPPDVQQNGRAELIFAMRLKYLLTIGQFDDAAKYVFRFVDKTRARGIQIDSNLAITLIEARASLGCYAAEFSKNTELIQQGLDEMYTHIISCDPKYADRAEKVLMNRLSNPETDPAEKKVAESILRSPMR